MKDKLLKIPAVRAVVTNKKTQGTNAFKKEYFEIFQKYKEFTMCQEYKYIRNLSLVNKFSNVKGSVVECGTWKGGMIGGIAHLLKNQDREYHLFDSFEGLPEAKEIDGKSAIDWQSDTQSEAYLDNCSANEEEAKRAMSISGVKDVSIHKGWFNETLIDFKVKKPIAILRLDGDWYESTMVCLKHLFPQLTKGGVLIIDDYYTWEGCSKAVHDYLSENKLFSPIHQHLDSIAYIKK